jgi:hypothetical protein
MKAQASGSSRVFDQYGADPRVRTGRLTITSPAITSQVRHDVEVLEPYRVDDGALALRNPGRA